MIFFTKKLVCLCNWVNFTIPYRKDCMNTYINSRKFLLRILFASGLLLSFVFTDAQGELKIPNFTESSNGSLGAAVAISGEYAIVSDYRFREVENSILARGKLFVYKKNPSNPDTLWTELQTLTNSQLPAEDLFGDLMSIRIEMEDSVALVRRGTASSFTYVTVLQLRNGFWEMDTLLRPPEEGYFDFGYEMDIQESRIAISARKSLPDDGKVYIYEWEEGKWELTPGLEFPPDALRDFGASVSMGKEEMFVGSPGDNRVYVFQKHDNRWEVTDTLRFTLNNGVSPNDFGRRVEQHGSFLFIGSAFPVVHVFQKKNGRWEFSALLQKNAQGSNGYGTKFEADGGYLIVSSISQNDEHGPYSGAFYLYELQDTSWVEIRNVVASDGMEGALFAESLDISGNSIVVGAPNDELTDGKLTGSVYFYELDSLLIGSPTTSLNPEIASNHLTIFPNPFSEELNIFFSTRILSPTTITLYDIQGHVLHRLDYPFVLENTLEVSIPHLSKGLYWVEAKWENKRLVEKIMKH